MKRVIGALAIWTSITCVLAGAEGTPKIQFDKTTYDFGRSTEGEAVPGKFTFQNAGDGVLKVGVPDPSCGCTAVTVKPDTLKPGEKGEIAFTLDLANARGAIEKSIAVPSNDPQHPIVNLTIKGDSKAIFSIEPQIVVFEAISPGEIARKTILVKRLDSKKLLIGRADISRDFLEVKVEPEEKSQGQAARLIVEAKGTGQPEQFSDILSVSLENASKPAFHIPITGQLLAHIKVEPDAVLWKVPNPKDWPGPNPEENTTRKVIVSATRADESFDLGDFSSTFEDLMVKVVELEKGKKFEVTLKLPKPLEKSMQGTVSFETTLPAQRTVEIPVVIGVLKP